MHCRSALIVCPQEDKSQIKDQTLLGLTIGERLLLSLQYGGIEQVAFAGFGAKPVSMRSSLKITEPDRLEGTIVVLAADTVIDRGLLTSAPPNVESLPLFFCSKENIGTIVDNPEKFLSSLSVSNKVEGKEFAVRVTDRQSWKQARKCLLLSLRKPLDGFVSRHINRHISTFVTGIIVPWGIRPNQLTFVIMLIGIMSGVFAAMSGYWWALVLSGLCFQGQSILDGCDGEIARLTYRFSKTGQWLDTIGDDLTNYAFYAGLTVGVGKLYGAYWLYLLGAVTFVFQWATSITMYQRIYKMGTGDLLAIPDVFTKDQKNARGARGKIVRFLRIATKKDSFSLVLSIIVAAQFPILAFALMTFGTYPAFYGIYSNEMKLRAMERNGQTISKAK